MAHLLLISFNYVLDVLVRLISEIAPKMSWIEWLVSIYQSALGMSRASELIYDHLWMRVLRAEEWVPSKLEWMDSRGAQLSSSSTSYSLVFAWIYTPICEAHFAQWVSMFRHSDSRALLNPRFVIQSYTCFYLQNWSFLWAAFHTVAVFMSSLSQCIVLSK